MRVAIIGRTEIMYDTCLVLQQAGYEIACILTAKEAPEYERSAEDFKNLADNLGVPFARGSKITEHKDFLLAAKAEIAVSINYSGIIPQSIVDIFNYGILNAHGGDLPRYRGNACQAWAILNGEERIGLCIHQMIGGELDSGNIIARDYFPVSINTNVAQTWDWMKQRTPELFLRALELLSANPEFVLETQSKDPADALRCYPRKPEDGRIDWSKDWKQILRLINASGPPYSGAFCYLDEKKITIIDAEVLEDEEVFLAVPGQVLKISSQGIDVACGHGKLRLVSVKLNDETFKANELVSSLRERFS